MLWFQAIASQIPYQIRGEYLAIPGLHKIHIILAMTNQKEFRIASIYYNQFPMIELVPMLYPASMNTSFPRYLDISDEQGSVQLVDCLTRLTQIWLVCYKDIPQSCSGSKRY